jgi:hypothetical protein
MSFLLWPFYALWRLITFVLLTTGRLLCMLLGLILVGVGVAVTLTGLGAPIGAPLVLLGFLLLVRAIF